MSFKESLKKIPFVYRLYKSLHISDRIRFYQDRNKMEEFSQKGESIIAYVHKILGKLDYMFFVDAGTLIGIYRDGRLLKRDMDVDMGIVVKDQSDVLKIREFLINNGFVLKIKFSVPGVGFIQDAFDYDGIRVDMCYFLESDKTTYCYVLYEDNKIIRMTFSKISSIRCYSFGEQEVRIPSDSDKYLEERYGKNWRVPDPFFKYWEGPCVTPEDGIGVCEIVD